MCVFLCVFLCTSTAKGLLSKIMSVTCIKKQWQTANIGIILLPTSVISISFPLQRRNPKSNFCAQIGRENAKSGIESQCINQNNTIYRHYNAIYRHNNTICRHIKHLIPSSFVLTWLLSFSLNVP